MANDFSKDGHCVAVWNFEAVPGIDKDSKGSNDFTFVSVTGEAVIVKEGAQSARFQKINSSSATIADASLDAGFPFRFNDATPKTDITLTTWQYWSIIPSIAGANAYMFEKFVTAGDNRTFQIFITSGTDKYKIQKGYNNGVSAETDTHSTAIVAGRWYHMGIAYSESDKSYLIRIWDDTAGAIHGADLTGNFSETTSVRDVALSLDRLGDASYYNDEMVVWNIKKSADSIDEVRGGTYTYELRYPYHGKFSLSPNRKLNL